MTQLYLHGLGQTPDCWAKTIALLGTGEQSVCPDLAGLLAGRDASYQNLYGAFCEFCGQFDGALDLCGLSLGGVLGLNYAIDYPARVHSLVLIAAQYQMPKFLLRFQNFLFRLMPKSMFQQTGFGKAQFLRLCNTMADLDFSASLPKIACPVLVACGEKDSANRKAAVQLAGLLKNAELRILDGAGHEANIDAPEALSDALRAFYAGCCKSGLDKQGEL